MTNEEKSKELTRSSFAAQMAMLGYEPNGNPKDMVEVVRCKDCKYLDVNRCTNDLVLRQIDDCGCYPAFYVTDDWFCASGERQ